MAIPLTQLLPPVATGLSEITAERTSDPGATDDLRFHYVGQVWVNTVTGDKFIARSLASLAAVWDLIGGSSSSTRFTKSEDFDEPPMGALPADLAVIEVSASGNATTDYIADVATGEYALTMSADVEVQQLTLYNGDQRMIDIDNNPIVEVRFKFNESAIQAAGQEFLVGLGTDYNATIANITNYCWIRCVGDGANRDLLFQTDDGVAPVTADTTVDYVDDTFLTVKFDLSDLADPRVLIDGTDVTPAGAFTLAAAAGAQLQLLVHARKGAAAVTHALHVDYYELSVDR